jgi:methylated-DNA-protein-cysteine methyltransferase-like protein
MSTSRSDHELTYRRVYAVVRQIPPGQVATYGQIAGIVGHCTARMVGYALASLLEDDVPWQRVINSQGRVSPRAESGSTEEQRLRLHEEGVLFKANGAVDLRRYRWSGPPLAWLLEHGYEPMPTWQGA